MIFFSSLAAGGSEAVFRRIEYYDAEQQRTLVFLTNHLEFAPATIAAIYKDRWKIEAFFKALKQNLRVRTFVGTSANALKIQIWTALTAILLLGLEPVQSGRFVAAAVVCAPRIVCLAGGAVSAAAGQGARAATAIITRWSGGLIGTAA